MIEIKNVNKIYDIKEGTFQALKNVSLTIHDHEFVAILGESGSGKSTLLNMISGIDTYTSGEIIINGQNTSCFTDEEFRNFRFNHIGFVFQRYNLVEHLTTLENTALPLIYTGVNKDDYKLRASKLLNELKLSNYAHTKVKDLSGGQKQRVAIARSILQDTEILLCDEPTGSLDSESGEVVMDLIKSFSKDRTVLLVTHDESIAYKYADRIIRIDQGEIISDETIVNKTPTKPTNIIKEEQIPNHQDGIKLIAKKNFLLNRKNHYKVMISFILGITLMLMMSLFINNLLDYNFLMFQRNNDYKQYVVKEPGTLDLLNQLKEDSSIKEATYEKTYLVEYSFFGLKYGNAKRVYKAQPKTYTPNNVHQVMLKTIPTKEPFYLNDVIIAQTNKKPINGVYVSQELIYAHYLEKSIVSDYNRDWFTDLNNPDERPDAGLLRKRAFLEDFPYESFLGSSIYICGSKYEGSCFETQIIGILDGNEYGINYAGTIFISEEGFQTFETYLQQIFGVADMSRLIDSKIIYYYKDFNKGNNNPSKLGTKYNISIENNHIKDYKDVVTLRNMAHFIIYLLIFSLAVIYSIVIFNMIKDNIDLRNVDVGVYTSLGISRHTITKIFIYETIFVLRRLVLYLSGIYVLLLIAFWYITPRYITNNDALVKEFGHAYKMNPNFVTFVLVLFMTCFIYIITVMYYSHKASTKKASEVLSW